MPYSIRFSRDVDEQLGHLNARQRATVLDAVARQLQHQPAIPTRQRKRMREGKEGFVSPWELRVGDLRVYYDVQVEAEGMGVVIIHAIGLKRRNRLLIGGRGIKS